MNNIESQIKELGSREEPYIGMPIPDMNRHMGRHDRDMGRHDRDMGRHDRDMGRHDRDMGRHDRDMGRHDHHMDCPEEDHMHHDQLAGMALAMAYVPWQCWCKTYEPAEAHHRGTIFPELDLPFLAGGDC